LGLSTTSGGVFAALDDKANEVKSASPTVSRSVATLILKRAPFRGRGLSDRTIERLIECGVDAPERLLFMEEHDLRRVGKGSMAEIKAYREKFVPKL
jgi:hypothetical protein